MAILCTYFTGVLKITQIACLHVTDTSKSSGEARRAARVVSEPIFHLIEWLDFFVARSVSSFVRVVCGLCQIETRGCLCPAQPINSLGVGAVANC